MANARSVVGGETIRWTRTRPTRNHVIGSVLFGLGWSVACTCPGPIAAQLGAGRFGALYVVGGVLTGIALRGWRQARVAAPAVEGASIPATAGL